MPFDTTVENLRPFARCRVTHAQRSSKKKSFAYFSRVGWMGAPLPIRSLAYRSAAARVVSPLISHTTGLAGSQA